MLKNRIGLSLKETKRSKCSKVTYKILFVHRQFTFCCLKVTAFLPQGVIPTVNT